MLGAGVGVGEVSVAIIRLEGLNIGNLRTAMLWPGFESVTRENESRKMRFRCANRLVSVRLLHFRNSSIDFYEIWLRDTREYPKVSGLVACSENCKWYSSLPLGAVVSLVCEP
jgi:hypothetical protein